MDNEHITEVKPKKPTAQRDRRNGLKPKQRQLAVKQPNKKLTGNQWQATVQQHQFMDNWINPKSPTFGNAYASALAANYSEHYAIKITAPTTLTEWIGEYRRKLEFTPEHINQGIQQLAIKANDSKSPDDTRLKALEILARLHGMLDTNRGQTNITIVQPILGGTSVTDKDRVIIDQQ